MYHSYRVTAETPQYRQDIGQQKNFKFISYDNLTTGRHTLLVNVTECVNQTFTFDYLTYTYNLPRPVLNSGNPQNLTKKTKIGLIRGNVSGFIILLLVGTVFIVLRRRSRYKYPRRKFKYYLKTFPLAEKAPEDSQYPSLTGPREAPSPTHLMVIWALSQALCLIHNRKNSHLSMVSHATQPCMETTS